MNRWLARPPRSADEVRRLQMCCDSLQQCQHCPFRARNAGTPLDRLGQNLLKELGG